MRKIVAGLAVGICAAGVVLGGGLLSARAFAGSGVDPLQAMEWRTYDWRLARTADPSSARRDLALVEIDEYSLRNLQPTAGRWPWPRAVHSMLLDFLARAPAKVVAYDVNFAEPDTRSGFPFGGATWTGAESDRALVDSVKAAGNVLLPVDASFEGAMERAADAAPLRDEHFRPGAGVALSRRALFPPFQALAEVASGFGHPLFVLDPDGPIRHTVPFVQQGDTAVPSLGLAAAIRAAGILPSDVHMADGDLQIGDRRMPLAPRQVASADGTLRYDWGLIDFRGPALLADGKSRPYASYAFFDLLVSEEQILANQTPQIDPSVFKDKVVFVGVTASGLFDVFETPFAQGKMPGVQVHAAIADDVLSGRFVRPASAWFRRGSVVTFALAAGLLAAAAPVWWAIGGTVALMGALWWSAVHAFAAGRWINLTEPTLSASLALFAGIAYQYVVEGREKRKMRQLFKRYVSRDVFTQLVAHPELARLGGQRREMTVLFSDIRGFTTISERGTPEDVVVMLNEYFTRMVEVVFRHQGTVDKFVGDMVMALFGAPLDDPDHAAHAVETALDMFDELRALNAKWAAQGRVVNLDIGIGINTGPMIAGNIGSDSIMSYTVIGDAVNLGARLQGLNKDHGTHILASETTCKGIADRFIFKALGAVTVKGKSQPVSIYEVVGRVPPATHGTANG